MESDEIEIIDDCIVEKSELNKIKNICNLSRGIGKIEYQVNGRNHYSSCALMTFERNNKPFFCIMTNSHSIEPEIIGIGEIKLKYENEKNELLFKLDKEERIIINFKEQDIDIIVIEIIPKDKIDESFFLHPKNNINEESTINQTIQIIQHPEGGDLSYSEGKISKIYGKFAMFLHEASTKEGSSGSPIVLQNEEEVIAIHKGAKKDIRKNVGIFIGGVVDIVKNYKRNGFFKEFYENGKLKYEGNFLNDEYHDDKGKYIDEDGYTYLGKFEKGKKNGKFRQSKDGKEIECEFKDDERIDDNKDEQEDIKETNEDEAINQMRLWKNIGNLAFHFLKPLGDQMGYLCGCGHTSEKHTEIKIGLWTCFGCQGSTCSLFPNLKD